MNDIRIESTSIQLVSISEQIAKDHLLRDDKHIALKYYIHR